MRVLFALAALLFLATFSPPGTYRPEPPPPVSWVRFEPLPLDAGDPARTRLGGLRFLGAWRLASNDPRFGGLSSLHVEGGEAMGFSDAGWLIRFPLPRGGGPVRGEVRALADGPAASKRKSERDIESMAVAGDEMWLGFERRNVVWRYGRRSRHAESGAWPSGMRRWPANRGAEAMLRFPDGRFLVLSEGNGSGGPALLFAGDPAVEGTPALALRYQPPDGYRATDAALLPDGRILVLNRRWRLLEGLSAKLTLLRGRLAPGAVLRGIEVADFHRPVTVDNMEGLSVTREGGRTVVWLVSDDNYSPLQRTLLMKFALE
ncbi:MAG: esterase-like of phytase family protein [Alphaproteobacteria bacterium]|nr:esterase-like of phytase family protein [Alphaproteobacteria bacterium]